MGIKPTDSKPNGWPPIMALGFRQADMWVFSLSRGYCLEHRQHAPCILVVGVFDLWNS
jgi:hypothetical protein